MRRKGAQRLGGIWFSTINTTLKNEKEQDLGFEVAEAR
jgi:hypothetical protein